MCARAYGQLQPQPPPLLVGEPSIHPEETVHFGPSASGTDAAAQPETSSDSDRAELEPQEQAFFNQKGFTTDAMGDVDASAELERTRKEAKIREAEHSRRQGG
jgi:hypothetical protein